MSSRLRRWTRPLRHRLALWGLRRLVALFRRLPVDRALILGADLARLIGWLARGERQRMATRLERALPEPPRLGDCWADLGRRFVEFAIAERLLDRVEVPAEAIERFESARHAGDGVLLATAHLGNWELMAAALARRGFRFEAVAAGLKPSPLNRWLTRRRAALGVRTRAPGEARAIIDRLRAGEAVALFVDQATGERARLIPFFGQPAPTPVTFERLLALTGARPLFIWISHERHRAHPRHRYRVHVEQVPPGPRPLDLLTARIEALVRAEPTAWVWVHDRWRDRRHPQPAEPRARGAGGDPARPSG